MDQKQEEGGGGLPVNPCAVCSVLWDAQARGSCQAAPTGSRAGERGPEAGVSGLELHLGCTKQFELVSLLVTSIPPVVWSILALPEVGLGVLQLPEGGAVSFQMSIFRLCVGVGGQGADS